MENPQKFQTKNPISKQQVKNKPRRTSLSLKELSAIAQLSPKTAKQDSSFFQKIATKKSLSRQDHSKIPSQALFDFYTFSFNWENYSSIVQAKVPLSQKNVENALAKFHNGLTLIILKKILNLARDDNTLDLNLKDQLIEKNSKILQKILEEINDRFALNLVKRHLYHDLEDYLSVYLFSSSVYQEKILFFARAVFRKKYCIGNQNLLLNPENYSHFSMNRYIEEITQKKISGEKIFSYLFSQIIKELKIDMDIYVSNGKNLTGKKIKLFESKKIFSSSPDFVLILEKTGNEVSFCFGDKVADSGEEKFMSFKEAKSRYYNESIKSETSIKKQNLKIGYEINSGLIKQPNLSLMSPLSLKKGNFSSFDANEVPSLKLSKEKNYINIEENFFSKSTRRKTTPAENPDNGEKLLSGRSYQKEEVIQTSCQEILTQSDDHFLRTKNITQLLQEKEWVLQSEKKKAKRKRGDSKTIIEIQGSIETLKVKANKKIMKKKLNQSPIDSKLERHSEVIRERIKESRKNLKNPKKLRFSNTESILSKITKKKGKRASRKNLHSVSKNGRSESFKVNKRKKVKSSRKNERDEISIDYSCNSSKVASPFPSPNKSKRVRRKLLEEIEEVKAGYFVSERSPGKTMDNVDQLIRENNIAITSVLQKFSNNSSRKVNRSKINFQLKNFSFF